jgi:hypothetical protein
MLRRFRHRIGRFFNNSRTINNEPINKISLIVIILIDIFILTNVFIGLNDIGRWYMAPSQAYPCYAEWESYRANSNEGKDFEILRSTLVNHGINQVSYQEFNRQTEDAHLGSISEICLQYDAYRDAINTSENQTDIRTIDQKQIEIGTLEQENQTIRAQYDSTLLEEIAGQPRDQSINAVGAAQARQEIAQNDRQINTLKQEITDLKNRILKSPGGVDLINLLQQDDQFQMVEQGYKRATFWYPSIQIFFQGIFLLPLIAIALSVHTYAQRRGYGLVALLSWHLLVIFFIPLIIKVFELLQFGALFQFLSDIVVALLGGLLFLVSYVYILVIPLLGFGLIKFFQKIVFNTRVQAAGRIQKNRCIRCAKKIRAQDDHCPHCGYYQYTECHHCHTPTYKYLPYCKECGTAQNLGRS